MDPNQPNAMSLSQAMHDVPIEAHMMSDHLNHQHHSMGHPQLSHSTPIDPSMEIASKSLPHAKSQLNSPLQGDQMNHLQQKMDSDSALTHQLEQSEIIETVQFDTPQSPDMALGEPKEGNFSEPNPDLTCDICHKTYENKRFLNYHYTSTHKEQKKNLKCAFAVLADCTEKFRTRKDYEDHLQTEHKCGLSQETLQFNDITEFELWKHKMEETTNSHFVLNRGGNKYKNGQTVRGYKCSRSGDKPRAATGKKSKKQQPEKNRPMGAECPAYIRAVIGENKVDVTFISTHIGHTVEPFSQSLHREAKKRIVMKRMKLEERHQAYNSRRIRQERLVIQRSDIINDLNSLDLSLGGLKGERVEKVLQMLRLTLDMYKDAEGAVSNVELQENGNQLHSVSNEGSNLFVTDDMIIF